MTVRVVQALDMGEDVLLVRGTVEGRWLRPPTLYSAMTLAEMRATGLDLGGARTRAAALAALAAAGYADDPGEPEVFEARGWVSAMTSCPVDGADDFTVTVDAEGNEVSEHTPQRREMTPGEKLAYCRSLIESVLPAEAAPAEPVDLGISG